MDVRERMHSWRVENDKTLESLSVETGVSSTLLAMIENGGVTHPEIAKRIAKAYGLTKEETLELIPKERGKPHELITKIIISPRQIDEGYIYIAEHQKKMRREHQRRGRY